MEDQSDKAIDMKFLGMCGVSLDEVPLGLLAGPPAEAESQDELEDEPHAHETDQTEAHDEGSSFRDEHQDLISVEYELQPLPIPNPGPPPHHDRIRRFREDVIYYLLAQKNRNCLSDNMMKVIYEMGTAVTGGIPIVGIEEVEQLEDQLVNECLPISRFMCSCCKALLPTSTSDCTSLSCRSYTRRRNTCAETIVITTYDILPQLKSIVNEQFDDILQCHERVHSGWIFSQSDDLVNFPFFKEHMESQAEFTTNKLWLQGVINSDGFSFEGNFRGSFWPVTIAIADLRASIRFSPRHMFTAGFVRAPTKPPTKALHLLFDRLRSDLRTRFPVYMNRNGVVYEIRLTITFPSLDNENVAPYINKHYRYSTISGPRKDRQYVLTNAPRCDGGFRGYSVFNRIVPLDNSTIDWLHDSLEGVYKTLIKDIISGKKRRGIRVRPRVIKTIDELCGRILMPTYSPARLLPLTKYKTGSGSCIAVVSY
ncbi:hypothetical protein WR25_11730 [Diploscapter pachys]|uniref:Uncharacterized protein n=1 Tax=Diploscapter pachys TaxID=2018661 RepID=A0A2A2KP72_9BILA|nr:hypothetical protein WR25_11730 [Diploscapter pachys]